MSNQNEKQLEKKIDPQTKEIADKIYNVGVKNGKIFMKNKILKTLNRDINFSIEIGISKMMRVLNKINKIK